MIEKYIEPTWDDPAHVKPTVRPNTRVQSTSSIQQILAAQSPQPVQPELFNEDTLIEQLPLTKKTILALRSLAIVRLGDFAYVSPKELKSRARVGRVTLQKIERWLAQSAIPFRGAMGRTAPLQHRPPPLPTLPTEDAPIDSMPLGPRALHSLKAHRIYRLSDLSKFDDGTLRNLPWIGAKVARDLRIWYASALGDSVRRN